MDFDTAWNRARKSGNIHDPDLFAASMYYPQYRQSQWSNKAADAIGWSTKARNSTPRQRPAPPSQVWSEYAGHSSRQRPIDPQATTQANAKARHDAAQVAFNNAELLLHSFKERW